MYLHIGMNAYVWSGHIIGIFDRSFFHHSDDLAGNVLKGNEHVIRKSRMIRYGLDDCEIKSYLLTTANEVHCSNIHCRTLRKRWDALARNQSTPGDPFR